MSVRAGRITDSACRCEPSIRFLASELASVFSRRESGGSAELPAEGGLIIEAAVSGNRSQRFVGVSELMSGPVDARLRQKLSRRQAGDSPDAPLKLGWSQPCLFRQCFDTELLSAVSMDCFQNGGKWTEFFPPLGPMFQSPRDSDQSNCFSSSGFHADFLRDEPPDAPVWLRDHLESVTHREILRENGVVILFISRSQNRGEEFCCCPANEFRPVPHSREMKKGLVGRDIATLAILCTKKDVVDCVKKDFGGFQSGCSVENRIALISKCHGTARESCRRVGDTAETFHFDLLALKRHAEFCFVLFVR